MINNSEHNNGRQFTEDEMDQLLAAFYPNELPRALDNLPSSWPQVMQSAATAPKSAQVTIAPQASPAGKTVPTANRGIAVAVATLAACLMLILFSNMGTPDATGTAEKESAPSTFAPSEETFNVSEGGTDGAMDENNTSLLEIDQIDLAPQNDDAPKKVDEKE